MQFRHVEIKCGDGYMDGKPRKSKRYSLTHLDPEWREKIFISIQSERLKLAVATLSASGCRPSELERGIIVRLKDGKIQIGIQGSKIDKESGRGQPWRLLFVDGTTPWGGYLKHQTELSANHLINVSYDAGGISQRLREKSREIWPRRKTLVSAYSYRHFIGKSMKESGESVEKIANTLGHACDFSQSVYGRAGSGKKTAGQHGIIAAGATDPVRHSPKTDRLSNTLNRYRGYQPGS